MKPTTVEYIKQHSATGQWTGPMVDGVPSFRYDGKVQPVEPFLKQMNIKLTKSNKYTEREENAGMGKSHVGGDTPDVGSGVSEEQE